MTTYFNKNPYTIPLYSNGAMAGFLVFMLFMILTLGVCCYMVFRSYRSMRSFASKLLDTDETGKSTREIEIE